MEYIMRTPEIGQAMASYICNNKGEAVLFDSGLKESEIKLKELMAKEEPPIKRMSVIISHEHKDHIDGIIELLKDLDCPIEIDKIYIPDEMLNSKKVNEMRKWLYIRDSFLKNQDISNDKSYQELTAEYQKWNMKTGEYKNRSLYSPDTKILQYHSINVLIKNGWISEAEKLVKKWCEYTNTSREDFYKEMAKTCNLAYKKNSEEKILKIPPNTKTQIKVYDIGTVDICYIKSKRPSYYYANKEELQAYPHNNNLVSFLHLKNGINICFPGDASKSTQNKILEQIEKHPEIFGDKKKYQCQIMILPHHGSWENYISEFVEMVKPEIAISQAQFAIYGHPDTYVVYGYERAGASCLKTEDVRNISFYIQDKERVYFTTQGLLEKVNGIDLGRQIERVDEIFLKEFEEKLTKAEKDINEEYRFTSKVADGKIKEFKNSLKRLTESDKIEQLCKYLSKDEKNDFIQSFNHRFEIYDYLPEKIETKLSNSKVGKEFVEKYNTYIEGINALEQLKNVKQEQSVDIDKLVNDLRKGELKVNKIKDETIKDICKEYKKHFDTLNKITDRGINIKDKDTIDNFYHSGDLVRFNEQKDLVKTIQQASLDEPLQIQDNEKNR